MFGFGINFKAITQESIQISFSHVHKKHIKVMSLLIDLRMKSVTHSWTITGKKNMPTANQEKSVFSQPVVLYSIGFWMGILKWLWVWKTVGPSCCILSGHMCSLRLEISMSDKWLDWIHPVLYINKVLQYCILLCSEQKASIFKYFLNVPCSFLRHMTDVRQ